MSTIYVVGHRNPDTDSIASAMGYAELKQRLSGDHEYTPARLGELNAQTSWALGRAGLNAPPLLPHVKLRASDVMQPDYPTADHDSSLHEVGLRMAASDLDLIPIVDGDGAVVGMVTARDLARRYIKESGEPSSFDDRPVSVDLIVDVLGGELLMRPERRLTGRLWAVTVRTETMGATMGPHDIAVIGDRADAQRRAVQIGAALLVTTYGSRPDDEVLQLAAESGTGVIASPFDSYVTGRMLSLSVPVREVMSTDPLTVEPDDLASDVADLITDVHYSAAVVVDERGVPSGLVTRSDLVNPEPRRVLLVDHAELAQSVPGVEEAQIVEILDHHHIGSVETRLPVAATFDPVGSTSTLVVERFLSNGREPRRSTATMLLAGILSDTLVLSSPTTTQRDHDVVGYLEELLDLDARELGNEMFAASSDVDDVPAADIIRRDSKDYEPRPGRTVRIAQIETVGHGLMSRRQELLEAMERARAEANHALFALMITDIVAQGTDLLVAGDSRPVERAFGIEADDGAIPLPGVVSRKKQVAPKLLASLA